MNIEDILGIVCFFHSIKKDYPENSARKNFFLSTVFLIDAKADLDSYNENFEYGGLIGIGDSYLDKILKYSKIFRLHAVLHDACGAVRITTGKGPGYCYMYPSIPSFCLIGHFSGLLFCLYVKLFFPKLFAKLEI